MNEKEFAKLKVGDKVRIVSEKPRFGWVDEMDKYLGKAMIIREIKTVCGFKCLFMREDQEDVPNGPFGKGHLWFDHVIAEKIEPVKEVKRKAKKGEWIKIVNPFFEIGYKKGDIFKVVETEYDMGAHWVYVGAGVQQVPGHGFRRGVCIHPDEYVVLENYVPEDKPEVKQSEPDPKKIEEPITIVEHLVKDRKTIVKLSNGKVGVAVCSPEDEFDIYEGLRLAAERAYGKAEPYKKPSPVKEVKRKAKVGEWIKIVNPRMSMGLYKKGDIRKVVGFYESFLGGELCPSFKVLNGSSTIHAYDDEYVVLENYKPTK